MSNPDVFAPPARPGIPVVLSASLALWFACALTFTQTRCLNMQSCLNLTAAALLAGILFTVVLLSFHLRTAACLAAALALGAMLGSSYAASLHASSSSAENLSANACIVTAIEDGKTGTYGTEVLVSADFGKGAVYTMSLRYDSGDMLLNGESAAATVSFERIDFSEDDYSWGKGVILEARANSIEALPGSFPLGHLRAFRRAAIDALDGEGDEHALLQALACGYRDKLKASDCYGNYQTCGVAHLVAVSGAHLVIVTGLIASLLKALRLNRKVSIALLIAIMLSYLILAGIPVSAIRATIMSSTGLLALLGKRRPSSLNALGIGIFAIVAASPQASVSASFALSALSTLGIAVFGPLFQYFIHRFANPMLAACLEPIALTVSASLASQLYACSLFNVMPVSSLPANLVLAPLFPLVCSASLIAGIAGATGAFISPLTLAVALAPARIMNAMVGAIGAMPYASIPISISTVTSIVLSAAICSALWVGWLEHAHHVFLAAAAIAIAFTICWSFQMRADAIYMLDVGQGDAFLITSQGHSLLIDTGNHDKQLIGQLGRLHIAHIDSALITHGDDDHCGSLDALERSVDVDRVLVARDVITCKSESCTQLIAQCQRTADEIVGLSYHDQFNVGAFSMRIIWPYELREEGGNADSVCVLAEYDGDGDSAADFRALFTGDAESDQLAEMIESGDVGKVDLLKVGHHGSKNGMTADEAAVLSPTIAFIGVGEGNRYGHPSKEILDILESQGTAVFRSDLDGEVACTLSNDEARVTRLN